MILWTILSKSQNAIKPSEIKENETSDYFIYLFFSH